MNIIKIDMQKLRDTLPKNGKATLHKKDSVCHIKCDISWPNLNERSSMTFEEDFEMIINWQRQIVGAALSKFYIETTGQFWTIYLKRVPMEFVNATDEDIKTYLSI